MMSSTTRRKILALIQNQSQAEAANLAKALHMTGANIRYHLAALLKDGLIEIVLPRTNSAPGRGRPVRYYRLSGIARPNNLAELADHLLNLLLEADPEPERQLILIQQLAARLEPHGEPPHALTPRINRMIQLLNLRNYQAAWEARQQGPMIIFRNCPYAEILPDHPELCQMDRALLGHLTALPVNQTARINLAGGNPPACVFLLFTLHKTA